MYTTPRADQVNIADLRASADIIEEVSDTLTYIGFCAPGTQNTSEAKFSILKIEQSGTVQPILSTFKWGVIVVTIFLSVTAYFSKNATVKNNTNLLLPLVLVLFYEKIVVELVTINEAYLYVVIPVAFFYFFSDLLKNDFSLKSVYM